MSAILNAEPEPGPWPCVGHEDTFASRHVMEHLLARRLCVDEQGRDKCPFINDCRKQRDLSNPRDLVGTWAGELHGGKPSDAWIIREELRFTDAEARKCHNEYDKGRRTDYVRAGDRVYKRRHSPTARQALRGWK